MQNLLKKDKITSSFVKLDETGKFKNIKLEDLKNHISPLVLNSKVPNDVKKVFEASKDLYLFGYFRYYFFTISNHYAFLSLESALRNKYNELFGKSRSHMNLKKIISGLAEKNVINNKEIYNVSRELRNSFSHLTSPPIITPGMCLSSLEKIKEHIEELFD